MGLGAGGTLILLDKSVNLMQRLHSHLSLLGLDLDLYRRINDTCGHSSVDRGESQEAALQRVDEAMYRAKAKGRNRVELA